MSVKKALLRTIDRGPGLGAIEIRFNIGKAGSRAGYPNALASARGRVLGG
jgi:hypothetical protein